MNDATFRDVAVGHVLPELRFGPIDRALLALYAGASGDHNPIHIDSDYAKRAGAGDVFAQGMLSMALLGRLLTQWVPKPQIREFSARFTAITKLGATVICRGVVAERLERDDEMLVRLDLTAQTQDGETLLGSALVAVGQSNRQGADHGQP